MVDRILPVLATGFHNVTNMPSKKTSFRQTRFASQLKGLPSFHPSSSIPSQQNRLSKKKLKKISSKEDIPQIPNLQRVAINFFNPHSAKNRSFYPQAKSSALATSIAREVFLKKAPMPKQIENATPTEHHQAKHKEAISHIQTPADSLSSSVLSPIVDVGRTYILGILKKTLAQEGVQVSNSILDKFVSLFTAKDTEREKIQREILILFKDNSKEISLEKLREMEDISLQFFTQNISKVLHTEISPVQIRGILHLMTHQGNYRQIIQEFIDISLGIALSRAVQSIPADVRPLLTPETFLLLKKIYEDRSFDQIQNTLLSTIREKLSLPESITPEQMQKITNAVLAQDKEKLISLFKENGIEIPKHLEQLHKKLFEGFKKDCSSFFEKTLSPSEVQLVSAVLSGAFDPALLIKNLKREGAHVVASLCKEFNIPDVIMTTMDGIIKGEGSLIDILSTSIGSATLGAIESHGKSIIQAAIKRIWVIGPLISRTGGDLVEGGIAVIKGDKDGIRKALIKDDFLKNIERQLGVPKGFLDKDRFLRLYDLYGNHKQLLEEYSKSNPESSKELMMHSFLREQEKLLDFPSGCLQVQLFTILEKNSLMGEAFGKKMIKDGIKTLVEGGLLFLFPVAGVVGMVASTGLSYGVEYAVDALDNILHGEPQTQSE